MAQRNELSKVGQETVLDIEDIKRRLDMFDQRLDNLDSMITALVERVMSQPIVLNLTCPRCGKSIEIAIMGSQKPTK